MHMNRKDEKQMKAYEEIDSISALIIKREVRKMNMN
jgi:hypothetical protein